MIGQPLTDIFHFRGNAKDLFNKIFDHDGDGADFQVRLIHKNGSLADVTARAEMLNDEVGQRQCYALKVERIDQDRMAHLSSPHLEKALQRERERFLEIFNKAPVTMCILKGPNHVFESANERYLKFFDRRDIVGKTVMEVFPEAEGQGLFELMDQVYQTGETYSVSERLVQVKVGNSQVRDFYLTFMYQPYLNPEGEVEGIFYFGVDVTEQVIARKKIEEGKKLYVDLIQNLPVAVYTCDAEGFITSFNKSAIQLWGREPKLWKDKWCGSVQIYTDQGSLIPHDKSPMAISIKEKRALKSEEIKIKKQDGSFGYVVAFPSPTFDSNGNLTGGINVLVDITDRKNTEKSLLTLSLIAKKTINAVIITNPTQEIEWVNEAFTRMTGYEFDEAIGKKTQSLLHGEKTDMATVRSINEMVKKQQPFKCELLKYTKLGKPFWVEIDSQPVFDEKGKLIHFFDIETDITERKRAFERLVKTEKEIRNFARQLNIMLEEERSRIAREIHDEFGQQLTGLKMSLFSLKNISSPDNRALGIIKDMIENVEHTIRSLRHFSTELRPGILDTLGLTPSIEWLVQEFEKKTRIPCQLVIRTRTQAFEKNISINFFRICQEALTNISKYAEASNVKVSLLQSREKLSLTIMDNGKGIQLEKLEDPFSMGLIGMKERANLIGGKLEINKRKIKGTCIQVTAKLHE